MEFKLKSPARGYQRKDNGCPVSCGDKLRAGKGTSVWFLFQELFTEIMKSGSSLFLLVLSQQARGGAEAVTVGLGFLFTTHPFQRVNFFFHFLIKEMLVGFALF